MFPFILFVLVKLLFVYHCIESKSSGILDCSRLGISTFPHHARRNWVKFLDLKSNNITHVNLYAIMIDFPNIEHLDLRYNPLECTKPLRARGIHIKRLSSLYKQHSQSQAHTAMAIHHGSTSVLSPAAFRTSQVKIITPSASVSTPSPTKTGKNHILILSILLPVGVITFGLVCFYVILRRRCQFQRSQTLPTEQCP